LENMRSCLKVVAWLVLIAFTIQFFQAAPWLGVFFGGALAAGIFLNNKRKARIQADAIGKLGSEPLGNILDPSRALTASSARMLLGDASFDFEVVGESFYKQNFLALQRNLELEDGTDWDEVATLIADPGNQHSTNAVAVFVSGLKLGYVPESIAPRVFTFLLQNGGYAQADAAIYFSSEDGANSIWLDVALPPSFRP
jgi:hypothetical protein